MIRINIKRYREEKGWSQRELAEKLGVKQSAVGMWESGRNNPEYGRLEEIASVFGITIDELINGPAAKKKPFIRVPVLGSVPAGVPVQAIEDVVDWEELGEEYMDGREYVGIVVKGHSMEPTFLDGDVLIVQLQETADTGDDAIVFINGDDATFKRIRRNLKGVTLQPLNPEYEPLTFTNREIEELPVRIFGVAVEIRRKLR